MLVEDDVSTLCKLLKNLPPLRDIKSLQFRELITDIRPLMYFLLSFEL